MVDFSNKVKYFKEFFLRLLLFTKGNQFRGPKKLLSTLVLFVNITKNKKIFEKYDLTHLRHENFGFDFWPIISFSGNNQNGLLVLRNLLYVCKECTN